MADYIGNDYFNDHYRHNGRIEQYTGYCTGVWFEETMAWIRRQARNEKPFLVYLATNAPHVPLWAPQKYIDPYLRKVESRLAKFFGMIASVDETMGRLTALLDEEQRGTVGEDLVRGLVTAPQRSAGLPSKSWW